MAKSPICLDKLFTGRQFEREVIVLCVRWYLRFKLSFLDLVEMIAVSFLYRAVGRECKTVDFSLSARRDVMAAKLFFWKVLKTQERPHRVTTLDGYAASHRAVRELSEENQVWNDTKLRSSKYLNNIVEQDHRAIKARIGPVLGFNRKINAHQTN
jgi:transposase-like protein